LPGASKKFLCVALGHIASTAVAARRQAEEEALSLPLLRKKATRRVHLAVVEEGGGASPELIPGDRSEEQDRCDDMATVVGDRFLAINAMPDLLSRHGEAEATDGEDGGVQGSHAGHGHKGGRQTLRTNQQRQNRPRLSSSWYQVSLKDFIQLQLLRTPSLLWKRLSL
jgi:hypothetical protein